LKLFLVDDEPDITKAVKLGLEMKGFQVDAYNDPLEALQNFKPGMYDLALLDIRMPKLNGFELYRELLKVDDRIKVRFFTAFEEYRTEFKKAFPELDQSRFIRKPASLSNLVAVLVEESKAPVPSYAPADKRS
jgi:two-component system, OmpR family, response regulator ChvI